ncbi:hypothetical protein [Noviherbaspirillum malthae]|uniref:hypothetical protein n=1 Tax=Noviherbaspirillum malthae TaxID=1260987 RepID=UPI00188EDE2B|nr:hypothetical protein [Noviherbaspirillum malthae]
METTSQVGGGYYFTLRKPRLIKKISVLLRRMKRLLKVHVRIVRNAAAAVMPSNDNPVANSTEGRHERACLCSHGSAVTPIHALPLTPRRMFQGASLPVSQKS